MINQNLLLTGDDGYNLTKSLRFRSSASAYLNRTLGTPTNSKIWTYSGWVKRGSFASYGVLLSGGTSGSAYGEIYFDQPTSALIYFDNVSGAVIVTSAVYRDPSAWYHVVVSVDTTQATASNRVKIYVNGVQVTAFSSATYPTQNTNTAVNTSGYLAGLSALYAGSWMLYADQYLAEQYFIDGQALTPSSFGETSTTTGVWQPKKYTGTYGTNGFYLPFTDTTSTSTLGTDFSGNSNTWTVNNISLTAGTTYDSMNDVPTLTSATTANYCTLNPLNASSVGAANNGNLQAYSTSGANTGAAGINGTIALPTTGLYYFEVTMSAVSNAGLAGIAKLGATQDTDFSAGNYANIYAYTNTTGVAYTNNTTAYTGSTLTTGDILGVAVDMTNGALYFAKNNTWQNSGVPTSGASKTGAISFTVTSDLLPTCYAWKNSGADALSANFGQRPFAYTPPTGFVALNTFNLPTPTIGATASTQAGKYFNPVLWTGNGSTPRSFTGIGFAPDFAWIKSRSTAADHALIDSVRGTGSKALISNTTSAENGDGLVINSFDSDGYTLATGSINFSYANTNTASYVSWNWKANGTGSSNTQGSITSTVSANTTAGFSIVTYTGTGANATVGHGLGVAPSMIIVKIRNSSAYSWAVGNTSIGWANYLLLNTTDATASSSTVWQSTAPTSSVFSIGTSSAVNLFSGTFVAYCFAQIAGYSAFGSYTGNGSSDGPFVFTGFRPRFIMWKRSDSTGDWIIFDTARDTYNYADKQLVPNTSGAEQVTGGGFVREDFLSNGFKVRSTDSYINANGGTYIYMAFAENPFKYSNAR